jgi:hypothetical protein
MAFLDISGDEAIACTIKDELCSDHEEPLDTQPICESAWHAATLSNIVLPHGHVDVTSEHAGTNDDGADVRTTTKKTYKVHVDNLRPSATAIEPPHVTLHPTLQKVGDQVDTYDYGWLEASSLCCTIGHVLSMVDKSSQASGERAHVFRQSEEEKVPLVLQCRATEPFKKGQLLLVPGGGHIELIEKGDRDDSPPRAAPKQKKKLIDTSMFSKVRGTIRESLTLICLERKKDL